MLFIGLLLNNLWQWTVKFQSSRAHRTEDPSTAETASLETAVSDHDYGSFGECTNKQTVTSDCSRTVSELTLPSKKLRCSFFGYKPIQHLGVNTTKYIESQESLLLRYIALINSDEFDYNEENSKSNVYLLLEYYPI